MLSEVRTITCSSKDVPTAESLAFWYHELSRAMVLVCDSDRVVTYVPMPGCCSKHNIRL